MVRVGFTVALLLSAMVTQCQPPVWLWATGFRGSGGVQMQGVESASTNGCFATGSFGAQLYLPIDTLVSAGGSGNQFLAHVDSLGEVSWAAQLSHPVISMRGLADNGVSCLISFSGSATVQGQVVSGSSQGLSALIAEFDSSGNLISLVVIPGLLQYSGTAPHLHHAPEAGIALLGTVTDSVSVLGTVVQGPGRVLARITPAGDLLWAQLVDEGDTDGVGVVHVDASGDVLTCTTIDSWGRLSSYEPGGALSWQVPDVHYDIFDPPVLERRLNGDALLGLGHPSQGPIGMGTMLEVSHYDMVGALTWAATTSGTTSWYHGITSLDAVDGDASIVGGRFTGPITFGSIPMTMGGPNGFVGKVSSSGSWEWVVSQTAGNVLGFRSSPGMNSRIYTSGFSDTGLGFGSHSIPSGLGSMVGFVACLGDITLSSPSLSAKSDFRIHPNPASDRITIGAHVPGTLRVLDGQGRILMVKQASVGEKVLDVSGFEPGLYVLVLGNESARFIKE